VKGLFYGGGLDQLKAQFIGSATCVIAVFGFSLMLMYFLKNRGVLRLSREGELEGMDLHEHGTAAYHVEFGQGMTYTTPAGLPFNGNHNEAPSEEPVPAARTEE
jgi:Amt family ammonium transporter